MAISSIDLAYGLVYTLIAGSILAVVLVFLAYAFFPARDDTNELAKPPAEERFPVGAALANAAVLMSLVIFFMSSGSAVSVVVIMTAITVLSQPAVAGHGLAYGFILGNVAGGLAATAAYLLVDPRHLPSSCLSFCCSGSSSGQKSRKVASRSRFTLSDW